MEQEDNKCKVCQDACITETYVIEETSAALSSLSVQQLLRNTTRSGEQLTEAMDINHRIQVNNKVLYTSLSKFNHNTKLIVC